VIFSAVKVGIFDFIESAGDKICTAKELASQLNLHENSAERVMRMCVNLGLLKLETSQGPGEWDMVGHTDR
jgi:DNA-binding transcriptional regulator YhcF (GntR family)